MEMEVPRATFNRIRDMLIHKNQHQNIEFECRYNQFISKDQFAKMMAYLRSQNQPLKEAVNDETLDIFSKGHRITLSGKPIIQRYCATNLLTERDVNTVITKKPIKGFPPVVMSSINFKVDIKEEVPVRNITELVADLSTDAKMFRFKKRFSFTDNRMGLRFDMTISKTSTGANHKNFVESGCMAATEKYEFEIESIKNTEDPYDLLTKMIESYMVISGSGQVVANKEKLVSEYLRLTKQPNHFRPTDVYAKPKRFMVGPQPVSIERKNIAQPAILGAVSLLKDYTVTEKTDGERYLLFIDSSGIVYMINSRFDLMPTGVTTENFKNSVLDGEWVESLKIYALFDAYCVNGVDVRGLPLVTEQKSASKKSASGSATHYKSRLDALKDFHKKTSHAFTDANVTLYVKEFLHGGDIFELSKSILDKQAKREYKYHIDGLIYTPAYLHVGGQFRDDKVESFGSWAQLIKWKPPEENTIDFLVKYERDEKGKPKMVAKDNKLYHVCGLYVGFQPSQWEKVTALQALTQRAAVPNQGKAGYMARRFIPPDAINGDAISTYYSLVDESTSSSSIEDDSIVEFAYTEGQWSVLRVRQDKTALFRKYGLSGTANDYSIALNIWRSIQNPVTKAMITGVSTVTESDIPDTNVYYSRNTTRDKFASKTMMDFHNHWVKNHTLIAHLKPSRLLDLACGKGGDLNKWVKAGVKDVVGFDYVVDNIENPLDGVYARLATIDSAQMPTNARYVFLPMDCSKLLRPSAAYNEKDREVARVLWGEGVIDNNTPLAKYWNMMRDFDVVSCQFAIHYFFENAGTLSAFLSNVDTHIKDGGYFIGTCLDGARVKAVMAGNTHIRGTKNERVIWDITKRYNTPDTEIAIGDAVDIYMESIGRVSKEFLVDIRLLEARLRDLGYEVVFIKHFDEIYREVLPTANGVYAEGLRSMSEAEKRYSFMNCAFCFKKSTSTTKTKSKIVFKKKAVEPEPEVIVTKDPELEPVAPQPAKKKIIVKKKQKMVRQYYYVLYLSHY